MFQVQDHTKHMKFFKNHKLGELMNPCDGVYLRLKEIICGPLSGLDAGFGRNWLGTGGFQGPAIFNP